MRIGEILRDLFRHMEWADATVWSSVHRLAADDKRLRQMLDHLHMTQRSFLDVWQSKGFDRGYLKERTLRETLDAGREFHRQASTFMAAVDEESLDHPAPSLCRPLHERPASDHSRRNAAPDHVAQHVSPRAGQHAHPRAGRGAEPRRLHRVALARPASGIWP